MGRFRKQVQQPRQSAPWDGPFAPPAPSGPPRFNPMVKTAAQLAGSHEEAQPAVAPAASAAA
jgi:hypothetical protein